MALLEAASRPAGCSCSASDLVFNQDGIERLVGECSLGRMQRADCSGRGRRRWRTWDRRAGQVGGAGRWRARVWRSFASWFMGAFSWVVGAGVRGRTAVQGGHSRGAISAPCMAGDFGDGRSYASHSITRVIRIRPMMAARVSAVGASAGSGGLRCLMGAVGRRRIRIGPAGRVVVLQDAVRAA